MEQNFVLKKKLASSKRRSLNCVSFCFRYTTYFFLYFIIFCYRVPVIRIWKEGFRFTSNNHFSHEGDFVTAMRKWLVKCKWNSFPSGHGFGDHNYLIAFPALSGLQTCMVTSLNCTMLCRYYSICWLLWTCLLKICFSNNIAFQLTTSSFCAFFNPAP